MVSDNDMGNTDTYPADCYGYACEGPIKVDTEMSIYNSASDIWTKNCFQIASYALNYALSNFS